MNKSYVALLASLAVLSAAAGGTPTLTSTKDTAAAQPCPSWYADREWNVSLWGTYAFTASGYPMLDNADRQAILPLPGASLPEHDRYLEADHAWGGGIDIKFFFARYFGIGVQGSVLDVRQSYADININFGDIFSGRNHTRLAHQRQAIGAVLGTFTFRYPIPWCRIAPYVFAGGGAIFDGGQRSTITAPPDAELSVRSAPHTKLLAQIGGGFEARLTQHIGILNDFTWNIVDGRQNNFGMIRSGLNLAF